MLPLRWNQYDFIECLEVVPLVELEAVYTFTVCKDGLRLVLTVWPYESVVRVELGAEAVPGSGTEFAIVVRGEVTRCEYKGREWLEFTDCVVVPSRFSYLVLGNPADRELHPHGHSIRIAVSPCIVVEWLRHERGRG